MSIRFKLYSLAGLVACCLIILSWLSIHYFSSIKILKEGMILLQKSETNMLMLRRNEKDFMARLDIKYLDEFKENVQILSKNTESMRQQLRLSDIDQEAHINELLNDYQDYRQQFEGLVAIYQVIGLTPDTGLQGALRDAVHKAESELGSIESPVLTAAMLMLRRHEKDFLLRKQRQYIDKFNEGLNVFDELLSRSDLNSDVVATIRTSMKQYQQDFSSLVASYQTIGLTSTEGLHGKMRDVIHRTETQITSLDDELTQLALLRSDDIYNDLIMATVFILLLIVFCLLFISRTINSRLRQFNLHLSDVALGSGDLSVSLNVDGKDEIAKAAHLFNAFVSNLRETFSKIPEISKDFSEASAMNVTISEQVHQLAVKQQHKAADILESVQQMAAATDEISHSTQMAADAANESNVYAQNGHQRIDSVSHSVNLLVDRMRSSSELTQQLEENGNNISTVLDVIRGIAEQTNLLALNAAIEAARAGEQGRGFAVVADEVRTLAQRTQNATSQIQELIENFQSNVTRTVQVMQEGAQGASGAAQDVDKAIHAIDEIQASVTRLFELNTNISSAAHQQQVISGVISDHVVSVNEAAQQTAQQSSESNESSQQIHRVSADLQLLISEYQF
jgi:methyl-accepting chemotaxis protein